MTEGGIIAVVMILVIGVCACDVRHIWRGGNKTAVVVTMAVIFGMAIVLFAISQSAKCCGMFPGLGWALALLAGLGLGALIGMLLGLFMRPCAAESPA